MPIVIGGLILSFLVMLQFGGTEIDRGLLILFSGDAPRLKEAARLLLIAAEPIPLLAFASAGAAYLFARRRRRDALLLLAIIIGGRLLVEAVQGMTGPLRPPADERILPTQAMTFPDGHAANASITGIALAFLATRHFPARALALLLAAILALAAGFGRVVLGGSWPSDVIGGWALGLAWTLLLLRLAGADLGDGTARPLRHSPPEGERDGRESQDRDRPPDG